MFPFGTRISVLIDILFCMLNALYSFIFMRNGEINKFYLYLYIYTTYLWKNWNIDQTLKAHKIRISNPEQATGLDA